LFCVLTKQFCVSPKIIKNSKIFFHHERANPNPRPYLLSANDRST
jgi:hypothetical protein